MRPTKKSSPAPLIVGVPAGGLRSGQVHGSAGAVAAGAAGEERTAAILNRLAEQIGFTVIHDFMLPSDRYTANVDHAIVSGNRVILTDSKVWQPGFYWGMSTCRRGWEKFPPADKRTMPMAVTMLGGYLRSTGATVDPHPLIIVWPANARKQLRMWAWMSSNGTVPVHGDRLEQVIRSKHLKRPANPEIVDALSRLLVTRSASGRRRDAGGVVIDATDDWG